MTLALYGGPSAKLTLVLPIQSVRNPTRTVLALGIYRRSEQETVGTLGIPSALAQPHSQKFIWQAREKIGSYLVGPGFSDLSLWGSQGMRREKVWVSWGFT